MKLLVAIEIISQIKIAIDIRKYSYFIPLKFYTKYIFDKSINENNLFPFSKETELVGKF